MKVHLYGDLNRKYKWYTNSEKKSEEAEYSYVYYSTSGNQDEYYLIQIALLNNNNNIEQMQNKIKKIKVTVFYFTGSKEQSIDISTIIKNS